MTINIEVRERILRKTPRCDKDFACLDYKVEDMGKVRLIVNESSVFLECVSPGNCHYKESISEPVCHCLIRKEINLRYKI